MSIIGVSETMKMMAKKKWEKKKQTKREKKKGVTQAIVKRVNGES